MTDALGYELKALRSTVVPEESLEENTRKKRETANIAGASLQLYVYGLIEREPVDVNQLTE